MKIFAISESIPAQKWRDRFSESWPRYRNWYLSEGEDARPSLEMARDAVRHHMPELLQIYDRVCNLVEDDPLAQRALSLYRTPPIITGCSVALAPTETPILVRNYDLTPDFFEGTVLHSRWLELDVIATSEGWIGCLDGVNSDGLAVALTFGGRLTHGEDGFQTPLLLRYVLETCSTTKQAIKTLQRLPAQMVSNVMVLDKSGDHAVVYLSPDREMSFRKVPIATNHQLLLEWPEGNQASETAERAEKLALLRADGIQLEAFIEEFHRKPLYRTDYDMGLGTLYTVVIRPEDQIVEYRWPHQLPWVHSMNAFKRGERELPV
ncbi:C45 family peptidase [uncultured Cohaesibacter sp.]|uniref:C45 family peptidase n=1 Tax=uncultured Cohaesibacter sp. TaxID=1002546 RepID=UPI0029C8FA53|nr:C45 family peptidase [uncultured Cohaesibacter sp.]